MKETYTSTYFDKVWQCQRHHFTCHFKGKPIYGLAHYIYTMLKLSGLGIVFVSDAAYKEIQENDYYKICALVFEHNLTETRQLMLVVREEEELFKSIWSNDDRAVRCIDDFLKRFPLTLAQKKKRALYLLYLQHKGYRDEFKINQDYMLFAKDYQEREFILNSMVKQGWLYEKDISDATPSLFYIADTGWEQLDPILEKVVRQTVFIAMKFKKKEHIKTAIKKAIEAAGMTPLRIDEKEHINNIALEIQHAIQQSGLVVADLTGQNNGVYFEAGYAMALQIPVILCCPKKEQRKVHFDICQYNTILYEDEADLEKRLTKRIIAVMGLHKTASS